MTPEGSYAINPDNRVREYRTMVEGLHDAGLRVVQDVVFNHTNASGEGPNSNLDEVVPELLPPPRRQRQPRRPAPAAPTPPASTA